MAPWIVKVGQPCLCLSYSPSGLALIKNAKDKQVLLNVNESCWVFIPDVFLAFAGGSGRCVVLH